MVNFVKNWKNGQIWRNLGKQFLPRKMKNGKFWKNLEKNSKFC